MPKLDDYRKQLAGVTVEQQISYDLNLLPFSGELIEAYRHVSHSSPLLQDKQIADSLLNVDDPLVESFLEIYDHWKSCKIEFPHSVKSLSRTFFRHNGCAIISLWSVTIPFESLYMQTLEDLMIIHEYLRTETEALKDKLEILRQTLEEFKLEAPHLFQDARYEYLTTFIELILLETSIGLGTGYVELLKLQMEVCSSRINLKKSQFDIVANFDSLSTPFSKKHSLLNDEEEIPSTPEVPSLPKSQFSGFVTTAICIFLLGISAISALYTISGFWHHC